MDLGIEKTFVLVNFLKTLSGCCENGLEEVSTGSKRKMWEVIEIIQARDDGGLG